MIEYAYGDWITVGILVVFIGTFLWSLLRPRTPREWRSFGLAQAFFVALFFEMFGFPLTIYALSSVLGSALSFGHIQGHLLGVGLGVATGLGPTFGWTVVMAASTLLILVGGLLVHSAWKAIYVARGALVTTGPYRRVRHPQYLGLMILVVGFLVQWPTILTLAMAPFLVWAYVRLAKLEERDLRFRFPAYDEYATRVPGFLPRRRRSRGAGTTLGGEDG